MITVSYAEMFRSASCLVPRVTWDYRPARMHSRKARSRGFTLVELMVVIVIITGLASLAVPSILRQMRDRRTRQAAEEIASLYRQARLRALGRGAAVMVQYRPDTGFQTREAVLGGVGACATLPTTRCTSTNWGQGSAVPNGDELISSFNPTAGVYEGVTATAHATSPDLGGGSATSEGDSPSALDICFTPMGRTLFRTTPNGTLSWMSGVPAITVSRANNAGLKRVVVIPPNGLARTDVAQ